MTTGRSPDVSVVMGVYNGAGALTRTLRSILAQRDVDFELVAVDDGSTDGTSALLDDWARRDSRVRVIHQSNGGLTNALVHGCAVARGEFIARHDAGDTSDGDRLARQLACIRANPDAAFVSCGTRFVGPEGELLYEIVRNPEDAQERILTLDLDTIRGPSSHPSTLFPRAAYQAAGGYRAAFYFAQDIDLWIRLAERGRHVVMPEIFYETSITLGSISAVNRREQVLSARLVLECARARRDGRAEEPILDRAARIRPRPAHANSRLRSARALYFVGECLRRRSDPRARRYFKRAFDMFPLHVRSLARLLALP
jgi:glycosyltransferase involved in cell wall biosynthesis